MEKNYVLTQSPSLFDAPGTEAFASENIYLICYFQSIGLCFAIVDLSVAGHYRAPSLVLFMVIKNERKSICIALFLSDTTLTKRSDMDHTVLPANYTMSAFPS